MPVVRHHLRCLDCQALAPASLDLACERCGGLYEIDYPRLPEGGMRLPLTALPLGQGGTPTISFDWPDARRLRLELKLEYLSPTGSFKDRGAAMLISAAWSGGANAFVEDSSGNAGAALAAYAAAARISAEIFVPADAPQKRSKPRSPPSAPTSTPSMETAKPSPTPPNATPTNRASPTSHITAAPTSARA